MEIILMMASIGLITQISHLLCILAFGVKSKYEGLLKALLIKVFYLKAMGNTILPNGQMDIPKRANRFSQKGEPIPVANQVLKTFTKPVIIENEFSHFSKVTINDIQSPKVNPFTLIANVEKEKETAGKEKEKKERKPNPTYEAFTVFCQTFEELSGAAYPTDKNGHYIMSGKDAGGMVYLMRFIEQVDRLGNTTDALKVFLNAAWKLNDKWIKANFTPSILHSQSSKIFTAYQTTSPEAVEKKRYDRIQELLAERMAKYQD